MKLSEQWKKGSGTPTTGDITVGGFAVDVTNGAVYSKKANGEIFEVGALSIDGDGLESAVASNTLEIAKIWNSPSMKADAAITVEVQRIYQKYLGRDAEASGLLYWINNVNFAQMAFTDLEKTIYLASEENGETLLKAYISPEDLKTQQANTAIVNSATTELKTAIKSWYFVILQQSEVDNASLAYWIQEVQNGIILETDLDQAIFDAAMQESRNCYHIPDTRTTDYELGLDGIAQVKTTSTNDDLIIPTTVGGEVSIDVDDNVVVADNPNNVQAYIDAITANPNRARLIVIYYNRYFERNPKLEGLNYWQTDSMSDSDLERAIYVAGSMNGDLSGGTAYEGEEQAQLLADLKVAQDALALAQAEGDQTAINNAQAAANTAADAQQTSDVANQATIDSSPTRAEAIADMYREILGREPDTAGLAYWVNDSLSVEDIEATIIANKVANGGTFS